MSNGKLEDISVSNGNAWKVVENIGLWFDLVFKNHPLECVCVDMFKDCTKDKFYSIIMKLRQRGYFSDKETIDLQRKTETFYGSWFEL